MRQNVAKMFLPFFRPSIFHSMSSCFLAHVMFLVLSLSTRALTDVLHRIAQLIQDEECVSDTSSHFIQYYSQ